MMSYSFPYTVNSTHEKVVTPLHVLVSFFTQSVPSPRLLRSVGFLSEQAIRIAANQGLFAPKNPARPVSLFEKLSQHTLSLSDLIPQRTQDLAQFQAQNPFSHAVIISDKSARRLYSAIDGEKNVAELAQLGHLDQKEVKEALRYLFDLQLLRFRTPTGETVEDSPFQLDQAE